MQTNMAKVYAINTDPSTPYWAGGNPFSHLTFKQFVAKYLMQKATFDWAATGQANKPVGGMGAVSIQPVITANINVPESLQHYAGGIFTGGDSAVGGDAIEPVARRAALP